MHRVKISLVFISFFMMFLTACSEPEKPTAAPKNDTASTQGNWFIWGAKITPQPCLVTYTGKTKILGLAAANLQSLSKGILAIRYPYNNATGDVATLNIQSILPGGRQGAAHTLKISVTQGTDPMNSNPNNSVGVAILKPNSDWLTILRNMEREQGRDTLVFDISLDVTNNTYGWSSPYIVRDFEKTRLQIGLHAIECEADYAAMQFASTSAKYVLNADLNFSKPLKTKLWGITVVDSLTVAPIGTKGAPFTGVFDGKNHIIDGLSLKYTLTNNDGVGLFGVTQGAVIKDLKLKNLNIEARTCTNVGGFVGTATSSNIKNVYLINGQILGDNNVGSIVGNTFSTELTAGVSNSTISLHNAEQITSDTNHSQSVGGLVGLVNVRANQPRNVVIGYVKGSTTISGSSSVGGLVGRVVSSESIVQNLDLIKIRGHVGPSVVVKGSHQVGGMIGAYRVKCPSNGIDLWRNQAVLGGVMRGTVVDINPSPNAAKDNTFGYVAGESYDGNGYVPFATMVTSEAKVWWWTGATGQRLTGVSTENHTSADDDYETTEAWGVDGYPNLWNSDIKLTGVGQNKFSTIGILDTRDQLVSDGPECTAISFKGFTKDFLKIRVQQGQEVNIPVRIKVQANRAGLYSIASQRVYAGGGGRRNLTSLYYANYVYINEANVPQEVTINIRGFESNVGAVDMMIMGKPFFVRVLSAADYADRDRIPLPITGESQLSYGYAASDVDKRFDYNSSWAGNGFGFSGSQRGAPEYLRVVKDPTQPATSSDYVLQMISEARTDAWYKEYNVPRSTTTTYGRPDNEGQDDLFVYGSGSYKPEEREWSTSMQVYVPSPRSVWIGLRTAALGNVYHSMSPTQSSKLWPGIFLYSGTTFRVRLLGGDIDFGASELAELGLKHTYETNCWWTFGISVKKTGEMFFFMKKGKADSFTEDDLIWSSGYYYYFSASGFPLWKYMSRSDAIIDASFIFSPLDGTPQKTAPYSNSLLLDNVRIYRK